MYCLKTSSLLTVMSGTFICSCFLLYHDCLFIYLCYLDLYLPCSYISSLYFVYMSPIKMLASLRASVYVKSVLSDGDKSRTLFLNFFTLQLSEGEPVLLLLHLQIRGLNRGIKRENKSHRVLEYEFVALFSSFL